MGHMVGKDIYRKLGKKIDGLTMRAPWSDKLYDVLEELYTPEEAEFVVRMPFGISTREQLEQKLQYDPDDLHRILDSLCTKGLVMDMNVAGSYYYLPSPIVIGIFEFTMMRTGGNLETKKWAKLLHDYLQDGDGYFKANFDKGQSVLPLRTLPHEETILPEEYVEVLDYEKASAIVDQATRFGVGICSCRHEKLHAEAKECDYPLDTCLSFDNSVDFLVRHNMCREVSREEMLDTLARVRDLGLVLSADNIKKHVSFICTCCGCCCNVLQGISKFGYTNSVVTSNYIAKRDYDACIECGDCVEACPINAIEAIDGEPPEIDETICIGCGVCALSCESEALKLTRRPQRVFTPEDTFEKIVLQCLERGTLQNQMFSDPQKLSHSFMRAFVGAFLRLPPVKKALMGDTLRSRFLSGLRPK